MGGGTALITPAQPFTYFGGTPFPPDGLGRPCPTLRQLLRPKSPEIELSLATVNGNDTDENDAADGFECQGQSHLI